MPLENRVDPSGRIFRTAARGAMMGNRGGALHDERREIVRQWKTRRWIACLLEFRGRRRQIMALKRYTELFFLDEAVAFAAGHRPCAECRRDAFNAFKNAWPGGPAATADEMDLELHRARKLTCQAPLSSLPNGTFVEIDSAPWLVWDDALYLWTPEGYTRRKPRRNRASVTVLTPQPIVECFRAGYTPETHASRRAL